MLPNIQAECEPNPGTRLHHIKWMLEELLRSESNETKAHRWLGFIQGVLIMEGFTTVSTERDFTRPYFT